MTDRERIIRQLAETIETPKDKETYEHYQHYKQLIEDAFAVIKEQPEIVRCKDCRWNIWTGEMAYCKLYEYKHIPDFYCLNGDKKCCNTCSYYNGTYCCREWNNNDPDYCIPERDKHEPDYYCNNYEGV